jgi:hypothetical protein
MNRKTVTLPPGLSHGFRTRGPLQVPGELGQGDDRDVQLAGQDLEARDISETST